MEGNDKNFMICDYIPISIVVCPPEINIREIADYFRNKESLNAHPDFDGCDHGHGEAECGNQQWTKAYDSDQSHYHLINPEAPTIF
jgi:hypothetical protein